MPLLQNSGEYQHVLEKKMEIKGISFALSLSLFADTADPALLLGLECTLYNRCY